MGHGAGSFYRTKNKDQGREELKMKKEQGQKYGTKSCLGSWGWADWTRRVSGFSAALLETGKLSKFWFAEIAPLAGAAPYWA